MEFSQRARGQPLPTALGLGAFVLACLFATVAAAQQTVAVLRTENNEAADSVEAGLVGGLAEAGYAEGDKIRLLIETTRNDFADVGPIANRIIGQQPDVIIPVGVRAAQAIVPLSQDIPVVFTAVTDPEGAGLAGASAQARENVTGVASVPPLAQHLAMMQSVMPDIQRIGVLYNPLSDSASALLADLRDEASKADLFVLTSSITRPEDVERAAGDFVGKVDAIYVPPDPTVIARLDAVVSVGERDKLPVFSGDLGSVERGTIAAVGYNYEEVGQRTAELVAKVLDGTPPADIPVAQMQTFVSAVNPSAAERMGVTIPESVIAEADRVVGD